MDYIKDNKDILQIDKQYIGYKTSPEVGKCYCDVKGNIIFILQISSIGSMDYAYVLANGKLGKKQSDYYKDQSYWSPSKGHIQGPDRIDCYECKQKMSYCIRVEQQQDTLKKIYTNFTTLSPN